MATLSLLLVATFLLSIYDFRYRIVPNWITLPILLIGMILHFPANIEVWVGSLILVLFGYLRGGRIGFGDVKLWLAYFWMLPRDIAGIGILIGFSILCLTSLAQLVYFRLRKISPSQPYPAAWRVFVTVLVVSAKFYLGLPYA